MSQLASFLLDVSKDPLLLQELRREPEVVMKRAGLSAHDREVVRSGDADRIRREIGHEFDPTSIVVVAIVLSA